MIVLSGLAAVSLVRMRRAAWVAALIPALFIVAASSILGLL
jgi:hypothetical protein